MNEFFDDFDDFESEESMDGDSLEDHLDDEINDMKDFEDVTEPDDERLDESEAEEGCDSEDEFTVKDAFIIGGAMGWAYEEGLRKRKKRKTPKSEID
jgi:hypothetical protein